eukprot:TRINITY_DN14911_c0_g1_i2.p1 TRINITY_DN14911_c0_g1~~TRINITY_DN14911_c0_g1_i2.p1  ORF type:complete len:310 (+),score=54.48 TRINITY_DN14911_c0_g1_i2:111-932(+)
MAQQMAVFVQRVNGETVSVDVGVDASVGDILALLGGATGTLTLGGEELQPGTLLSDAGVCAEAVLIEVCSAVVLSAFDQNSWYNPELPAHAGGTIYIGGGEGGRAVRGKQSVTTGRLIFSLQVAETGDRDIHIGVCDEHYDNLLQYPWNRQHTWTVKFNDGDVRAQDDCAGTAYWRDMDVSRSFGVGHTLTVVVDTGAGNLRMFLNAEPMQLRDADQCSSGDDDEPRPGVGLYPGCPGMLLEGLPRGPLWPIVGSNYNTGVLRIVPTPAGLPL